MKRVLFVDDEPNVLNGIRRMLRAKRNEWDVHTADSGEAALAFLEKERMDVIVSDMQMPGMDGSALLREVKNRHPQTIRIVLSGHAEAHAVLQAFGAAHQYLPKPCDPELLAATIQQADELGAVLSGAALRELVAGIVNLPTLPETYDELVTALRSPKATLSQVGKIIGRDPAMTTEILKIVNSAYFGQTRTISNIERATTILGLQTVLTLALDYGLFKPATSPSIEGFALGELREHSVRTAAAARAIAEVEASTSVTPDDAFLAGIVHDVGQLVLATALPERYREAAALRSKQGVAWHVAEREVLGASHAEVGAYLLGLWGFSNRLVEAVAFHELPGECTSRTLGLTAMLYAAHRLAEFPDATSPDDPRLRMDLEYAREVGILDRWSEWSAKCGSMMVTRSAA